MATAVALSLGDAIEQQNKLIRMGELNEHTNDGGYRVLGRMMEMRHELSKGATATRANRFDRAHDGLEAFSQWAAFGPGSHAHAIAGDYAGAAAARSA